jgi:hypothetical protein
MLIDKFRLFIFHTTHGRILRQRPLHDHTDGVTRRIITGSTSIIFFSANTGSLITYRYLFRRRYYSDALKVSRYIAISCALIIIARDEPRRMHAELSHTKRSRHADNNTTRLLSRIAT